MKFTPLAGIETLIFSSNLNFFSMKFTPLAGIETTLQIWQILIHPENEIHTPCGDWNVSSYWFLFNCSKWNSHPLRGLKPISPGIIRIKFCNEIHTPCGDWNFSSHAINLTDQNEIHTPCGDWNTDLCRDLVHACNEIHTPSGDWNPNTPHPNAPSTNEIHTPCGDWN